MKNRLQARYQRILQEAEALQKQLTRLRRRESRILTEVPSLKEKKNAVDQAVKTGGPPPPGTKWDDQNAVWIDEIREWQISLHVPQTYYSRAEKKALPELEKIWSDIKDIEGRVLQKKDEKESLLVDAAIAGIAIIRNKAAEERLELHDLRVQAVSNSVKQEVQPAGAAIEPVEFKHSPDYTSVSIGGQRFTLTPRQAQVIQILHEAHRAGLLDVSSQYILERLGTRSSRLRDTFRSNLEAYRSLIAPGDRNGTYRLKM